jgi:hypothetical protein
VLPAPRSDGSAILASPPDPKKGKNLVSVASSEANVFGQITPKAQNIFSKRLKSKKLSYFTGTKDLAAKRNKINQQI